MNTDQWNTAHFTGTKINKARWLPRYDQIGRATFLVTGTWEEKVNKVTLWQFNLPEGDDKGPDAPFECFEGTQHGGVTDLKAVEAGSNVCVLTTSTKGSYSLYKVPQDLFAGEFDEGQVMLLRRDLLADSIHTSAATAIDYSPEFQEVVTVGEDGTINSMKIDSATPEFRLERAESCAITSVLFLNPASFLTTASNNTLKRWDLRSRSLAHNIKDPMKTGIITAATKHPFQLHRLTTAYSDGTIALWDLRQNAVVMQFKPHGSHVWEVQHHLSSPDNLYSCSEDGHVYHWDLKAMQTGGRGSMQQTMFSDISDQVASTKRVLVTDRLGINSFHVNPETNVLVSAGDTLSLQFRYPVVSEIL